MPHYRLSEFLPIVAGASSMVSRPVGRGIDVMEREDDLSVPVDVVGEASLPGLSEPELSRSSGGAGVSPAINFYQTLDPVALSEVEDRRLFHPEAARGVDLRTVRGSRTRLDVSSSLQQANRIAFVSSSSVITCVRRRIRREVIFAKGKSGGNRYVPPGSYEVCE